MKTQLRYYFDAVERCNMCDSPTGTHQILGKRLNKSQGRSPRQKTGLATTVVKCTVCDLIYSNPQPIPFDIQDHYGVPPEHYWKDSYFEKDDNYFSAEIARLKQLLSFRPGLRTLDIGAGLGKAMLALSRAGCDAYGFEASKDFHERAITRMGVDPDRLKLGTIEAVNYPDNSFDFVSFGAVLEHLYDPSDSILKAMRWLRPGGIMHIEVPSSDWLISKIANLYYR